MIPTTYKSGAFSSKTLTKCWAACGSHWSILAYEMLQLFLWPPILKLLLTMSLFGLHCHVLRFVLQWALSVVFVVWVNLFFRRYFLLFFLRCVRRHFCDAVTYSEPKVWRQVQFDGCVGKMEFVNVCAACCCVDLATNQSWFAEDKHPGNVQPGIHS